MAKKIKEKNSLGPVIAIPDDVKLTAESQAQWARLVAGLPLERGPRLLFVTFDSPLIRPRLASHLAKSLGNWGTKVGIIELPEPFAQPLEHILSHVEKDSTAKVHFVLGLEKSLVSIEHSAAAVADLNFHRDRIPQATRAPLVFWLDSWTFKTLALRAPDFMAWRAGEFHLVEDEGPMSEALERYRRHLIDRFSKLTLYSVSSDRPLAVDLEQVFIKLTAVERRRAYSEANASKPQWLYVGGEPVRQSTWDAVDDGPSIDVRGPYSSVLREFDGQAKEKQHHVDQPIDSPWPSITNESLAIPLTGMQRMREFVGEERNYHWKSAMGERNDRTALVGFEGTGKRVIVVDSASMFTTNYDAVIGGLINFAAPIDTTLSMGEALERHDHLAIIGAPGSGKTTLLKYFALSFSRRQVKERLDLVEDRLPIYVALRDFDRFLDDGEVAALAVSDKLPMLLVEYLDSYHLNYHPHLRLPADFFKRVLAEGRSILLLDGLDEVADPTRRAGVERIIASIANHFPGNRFVLTSRPRGYESGRQVLSSFFGECTIRDFDDDQIKSFVNSWYLAVTLDREGDSPTAREEATRRAADLLQALKNDRVRPLSTNPLLLSILALIHQRGNQLPQRRVALYEECIEFLLGFWHQVKGGEAARELAEIGGMTRIEKRAVIEPVALWLHERGESATEVAREELERRLTEGLRNLYSTSENEAARRASLFVDIIVEHAGLMVERESGVFAFAHLTFQEFLAARALADRNDYLEVVRNHLHDPWWREVILLLVGHVSSPCTRRSRDETASILNGIWHASSPLEDVLRRDMLLAFRCLCDVDQLGVDDGLRRSIATQVFELWRDPKIVGLRGDLRELLRYAAPTPVGPILVSLLLGVIEDTSSPSRLAAAVALGELGVGATPERVLARLTRLIEDADEDMRIVASRALGTLLDTLPPRKIISLLRELGAEAAVVRGRAAIALARSSDLLPTTEIIAQLLELSRDSEAYVRRLAVSALGRLGEAAATPEVLSRLLELSRDPDDLMRTHVAWTIGRLGNAAARAEVIARLVALIQDPFADVCDGAANALKRLGATTAVDEVISSMLEATRDSQPETRGSAATVIARLLRFAATREVLSRMLEVSQDADPNVRYAATSALGSLASSGATKEVASRVLELSADLDASVRFAAANALANLNAEGVKEQALNRLLELIRDTEPIVRSAATHAFERLSGSAPANAVPRLLELLRDSSIDVRGTALSVLERLRLPIATPQMISRLIELSHERDAGVRASAAYGLGVLETATNTLEVVSRLLELIVDPDANVREGAAAALGRLGSADAPPEVLSRMLELMKSGELSVRANVACAVGQAAARLKPQELTELLNFWREGLLSNNEGLFGGRHAPLSSIAYDELKQLAPFIQ